MTPFQDLPLYTANNQQMWFIIWCVYRRQSYIYSTVLKYLIIVAHLLAQSHILYIQPAGVAAALAKRNLMKSIQAGHSYIQENIATPIYISKEEWAVGWFMLVTQYIKEFPFLFFFLFFFYRKERKKKWFLRFIFKKTQKQTSQPVVSKRIYIVHI